MVWKLLATVLIVLVLLAFLLSSNPQVTEFFSSIYGGLTDVVSSFEIEENRTVNFTLILSGYENISYDSSKTMNITLNAAKFQLTVEDANLNGTANDIFIINYRGKVEINDTMNNITLDGRFESLLVPGIASFSNTNIVADIQFTTMKIDNFRPRKLVANTTGTLTLGAAENTFTGIIEADSILGTFTFDDGLTIVGHAKKISIPGSGITVG